MKNWVGRSVTRARRGLGGVLCAALAVGLVAVAATSAATSTPTRTHADAKVFFIIPELANPFWIPGKKGAEAAAKKYGVDLHIVGTPQFDARQQLNLFQDAQTAGANGILLVPGDPKTLNTEIRK